MNVTIRAPQGISYTESVGDILCGENEYEILHAHFWEKEKWRLKNKENKEIEYILDRELSAVSRGKVQCILSESSDTFILLQIGNDVYSLHRAIAKGTFRYKEIWIALRDQRRFGEIEFRNPMIGFDSLSASYQIKDISLVILLSFYVWENCYVRLQPDG